MKKIVAGGFLSLVGSICALAILVSASNSLVNEWVTETGRLMSTVIEMKMMFPLILCVICIAFGIIMMLVESFRRDKKIQFIGQINLSMKEIQPIPAGCSVTPYTPTPLLSWQMQEPVYWEKYLSRVLLSPGWY